MNAKDVMVGVLIHIPHHMIEIYELISSETGLELTEIVANDCNDICQKYFQAMRSPVNNEEVKDERQNSKVRSKES